MSNQLISFRSFCVIFTLLICAFSISAQTTAFTYQGRFTDSTVAQPTIGVYTMKFRLYDALNDGNQVGSEQTVSVSVVNGIFTTALDFGAAPFTGGQARWLEIQVGTATLTPRQKLGSVPYAIRAISSTTADTLSENCDSCITSSQIASLDGSKVTGTVTDATNAVNATTSNTALSLSVTSGDSVVSAINNAATNGTINSNRLSSDVVLINPGTAQTPTVTLPGNNALLNLTGSFTNPCNNDINQSSFRVNADGGLLSVGNYDGGCSGFVPAEGSGTRMFWYPGKGAFRAGYINGTQWDDANIGNFSTAFGENVRALGDNSIALGKNTVAANVGTIALGEGITATGANSVALGYGASTSTINGSPRTGSFVFSDRSVPLTYSFNGTTPDIESQFHPTVTNSFNVRAVNGSFFYTNTALTTGFIFNSTTANLTLTNSKLSMSSDGSTTIFSNSSQNTGVTLPAGGGSWNSISDRNMKENFGVVDTRDILRKVLNLPISTWNYKTQSASVRHIGAMAQDFYKLFGVGEDDKRIATIDPDGVAFAAIQGLSEELKDRDVKIEAQQKQLNELSDQVKKQQATIELLTKLFCAANPAVEVCKP